MVKRCRWANTDSLIKYHDLRWGKPLYDDKELFAMLCLEGMQAGLSWSCILNKEKDIRDSFDNFNIDKIINYDENKINMLMNNANIIRNRRKIDAVINNAKLFKMVQREYGSFSNYIWQFTNNKVIINHNDNMPAKSELSDKISADLKKRGFKFVGSVIIYSYLEAIGIIDDHEDDCICKTG